MSPRGLALLLAFLFPGKFSFLGVFDTGGSPAAAASWSTTLGLLNFYYAGWPYFGTYGLLFYAKVGAALMILPTGLRSPLELFLTFLVPFAILEGVYYALRSF